MKTPVAFFRLGRTLAEYKRKRETVHSMPVRLWIETSTLCNLECTMCPNKDLPAENKAIMDLDLFEKIVDEASSFASDMYLHHRGEPFINPQLFSMIRYAEEEGIRTRFHTNGTMLTSGRADKLLDAAPSMVSFSVDGFEKASYEQVRQGASFEKTIENILYLACRKRERKLKKPYIVVERIRFKEPDEEASQDNIDAMRQRLLDAGVDEVIEKEEYTWAQDSAASAERPRVRDCCTFPWYAMVVCADGTVTPCPQDFEARMVMGNVRNATLRDIWNGEPYRKLRSAFREDLDSLELCSKCDRLCQKTVGGVPVQYAKTFLVDQFLGYGKLRKLF
ncbi:MAG: radical SAM protein, partial [Verrucomicrobia bacterium]|nr:radical SAM protein [Verrucomicrobiota bacterium]